MFARPSSDANAAVEEPTRLFLRRETAMADLRGTMVGGYQIERELARGGMGIVYLATHPLLGTHAAVKVLHRELSSRPDLTERFLAEARTVAAIQHPHIVKVYNLASLPDGRLCLVMEYLEGQTMEQVAGPGAMPPQRVQAILLQLCSALATVHRSGIIHRDLKTQNVLLLKGNEDFIKLLDFGLAKEELSVEGLLGAQETPTGVLIGSPYCMAPEQVLGQSLDRRVDIYALGVLAYRLLVGAMPFEGTPSEVIFQHAHAAPRDPLKLPAPLRDIVLKALAKRPEDRFQDMGQFAAALRAASPPAKGAAPRPTRPPFDVRVDGSIIRLRFMSEEAFRYVESHELNHRRLFVPGQPPKVTGLLTLVIEVPGRVPSQAPVSLLATFSGALAGKYGMGEGFALELHARTQPEAQQVVALPAASISSARTLPTTRAPQRFIVAFGVTEEMKSTGLTNQISADALEMTSRTVEPVGTKLILSLILPGRPKARLEGVVLWQRVVREQSGGGRAAMGVRLTRVDSEYLQLVASAKDRDAGDSASAAITL